MEILFCGTAAAEGWPALFCTCDACQEARRRGGKDIRSRAAYMLDDRVRIDFGPDSNLHQQKYNLAYEKLEHLLVTHSHDDHWFVHDMAYRKKGFSVVAESLLQVWGNSSVEIKFTTLNGDDWSKYSIEFHPAIPWKSVSLGDGLTATPILAAHDRSEACLNYILAKEGRAALIGHDTGWYDPPTWDYLSDVPIDLLVLDCTHGTVDNERNHLGGMALIRFRDELEKRGALRRDARCIATHFSHNSGDLHEDLERFFIPQGFEVAYDGLRVKL